MAFGSLEIASIPRTQDYTVMKQNEDNKGTFQQMTLGQQTMQTGTPDNTMPRKKAATSMRVTAANATKSSRRTVS